MTSLLRAVTVTLLFLSSLPAQARSQADDLKGVWKPIEAELGGVKLPESVLAPLRLELGGGKYVLKGAESPDRGTVTVDATKKPRTMDVTGTDGPNKGKTFPCIYELEGDTLRICYDLSGQKRPTEYKTTKGTKLYLVTYTRDK